MDDAIIKTILNVQNEQAKAVLATIIRTEGSTPRKPGTRMLIMENGQISGTIGGGTAEKHIYNRALALLSGSSQHEIQRIEITQELGTASLPACGGKLEVMLELVQDQDLWRFAWDLQKNGQEAVMLTSLFPPYLKSILDSEGNILWGELQAGLEISVPKLKRICSTRQAEIWKFSEKAHWFAEPILKTERLLILGAGHVAREVAYYAKPLDFQVTVIDERAEYALPEFFPGACTVIRSDFDTGINHYQPDSDTYVVIATWSHQTDAACVKKILNFPAKYVGMLGSAKKVAAIVKNLRNEGYTDQHLAHLRAPIGLAIGAQTPSEIALSILAEVVAVRRIKPEK